MAVNGAIPIVPLSYTTLTEDPARAAIACEGTLSLSPTGTNEFVAWMEAAGPASSPITAMDFTPLNGRMFP